MRFPRIRTIRGKLFVGIVGVVALFVLLSWVLNWQLLGRYYHRVKTASLVSRYRQIRQLYEAGDVEALALALETIERKDGLTITVVDADLQVRYSTMALERLGRIATLAQRGGGGAVGAVGGTGEGFVVSVTAPVVSEPFFAEPLRQIKGQLTDSDYIMMGSTFDDRLKLEFISLLGVLSDGGYVMLRTPVAPVQESASAANRFFLISGTLVAVAGSLVAYWYAGRFTRPVERMKVIAEKVAGLDFSERYEGDSDDEIGALGSSINEMSRKLEATIGELREANVRLQEDIQRERRIDELRKEFIANVSHELKTPIALIQGYAEGLKLNINEDEETRAVYCDVIMDETARMNRLVGQLLKLSQIELGYVEPLKSSFDMVGLINRGGKKNSLHLDEYRIELSVEGESHLDVVADIDMMEQVLVNYITNAINNIDDRRTIRISVEKLDHKARVSVFNTGEHIPADCKELIWSSFYKLDRARTRSHGGTGLGLSIVKAVQDAHGNACGCDNVEGGVAFWFDVDLAENDVADGEEPA